MQSIKEHNLKANHNFDRDWFRSEISVCNLSKNTIWKQITTVTHFIDRLVNLYAIYQRTQSESKSQPAAWAVLLALFCMQSIKEHNLKANHNYSACRPHRSCSVCNLSKNTIWKQITTSPKSSYWLVVLYAIYQRTQSESKSQLSTMMWCCSPFCMQSIKEHNLKANHNQ